MGNIFNDDFSDFISSFNKHNVEYILAGGMAVILNGYVRTTGDMDVWVERSNDNYTKIQAAFIDFGMQVFDMTREKFLSPEYDVWSFGRDPVRIDLMTELKGLNFQEAFEQAQYFTENNISFRFLHVTSLMTAKKASGRHRDLDDIDQLSKKS